MLLPDEAAGRSGPVDVAVTVLGDDLTEASFALAAQSRGAGMRASVYLGSSGKLSKQLRWASDLGAHWCLIYGNAEHQAGTVTVRDLVGAQQEAVPFDEVAEYLAARADTRA
jgi:histidyl-tRNA synthetase